MKRSELKSTAFTKSLLEPVAKVRLKTCAACKLKFIPARPLQKACSGFCAQKHMEAEKARKAAKERREGLSKLKTRSDYVKETQVAFNSFIRERDKNQLCISSGAPLAQEAIGGGFDCGHYRSVGSAPHLRFDERNAHGQSKKQNRYLSGNAVDYRVGLIARIGMEAVEALEADDTPRKYSIDELKSIKTLYVAKLRQLKEPSQ